MAVVVDFDGSLATLQGGVWQGGDEDLIGLLATWTKTSIETAVTDDDPFFDLYSSSNPYPDYTIAQAAAEYWKGKIVHVDELGELDEDAIY